MKTKKTILLALSLMVIVAIAGCQPANNNTGYNTRLGTQMRIGDQGTGNDGWPNNTMQNGQNPMLNRNTGFNDGLGGTGTGFGGGTGLNNNIGMNDGFGGTGFGGFNNVGFNNNNLTTNMGNLNNNANELARRIGTLPEVTSASVVTNNNNAVVGLRLRNNQALGTALRQRIETMVRDATNISNVSITADPELFTRIQNMSNGMNNGNGMMNTIGNDIEDLIQRITPNNMNRR